jgi:L-threonylcarbamoyladenylate synthase
LGIQVRFGKVQEIIMNTELPAKIRQQVKKGITILQKGGVIAFPTDTVYGVGAGIYNEKAIERVFEVKKRTRNMSLPVLLADVSQVHEVATDIPAYGWRLIDCFWPGGLTLIVYRTRVIKDIITNGGDTVAIRLPDHPVPVALIRGCGMPLIGTSANISGEPSVTTAEAVKAQFKDSLELVVEGVPQPRGIESTIIDITGAAPVIIREGFIPRSAIEEAVRRFIQR